VSAERDLLAAEAGGAVFTSSLMTHIDISDVGVSSGSTAQASTPINGVFSVSAAVNMHCSHRLVAYAHTAHTPVSEHKWM
jgi:hypothetical protein